MPSEGSSVSTGAINVSLLVDTFERFPLFSCADDHFMIVSFLVLDMYIQISVNVSRDLKPPLERRLRPPFWVSLLHSIP